MLRTDEVVPLPEPSHQSHHCHYSRYTRVDGPNDEVGCENSRVPTFDCRGDCEVPRYDRMNRNENWEH